jgi:hypothetical protein
MRAYENFAVVQGWYNGHALLMVGDGRSRYLLEVDVDHGLMAAGKMDIPTFSHSLPFIWNAAGFRSILTPS